MLQCFLCAKACWSSSSSVFLIFSLAGVPAGHLFDFSGLLEFQQGIFLIFRACWSSSRPSFWFFRLAGVPADRLFDFSGLLEFQQSCFLIFCACWSSSRASFWFFELAGVPAGLFFDFLVVSKKVCKVNIILIFALSNKQQQEYGTYTRTNFGNYFELHK